jgi:uncharacterized protein YxeA
MKKIILLLLGLIIVFGISLIITTNESVSSSQYYEEAIQIQNEARYHMNDMIKLPCGDSCMYN